VIDADKYDLKKDGLMKGDKNKDGTINHHDLGRARSNIRLFYS